MEHELDELYLEWLYEQIGFYKGNPRLKHWKLLAHMLKKEFVWLIPNDDNRVEDGRDLRYQFVRAAGLRKVEASWMGMGCSILEMIIGVSRRLSFEAEGEPREWFWHLMDNLRISNVSDRHYNTYSEDVEEKLEILIWRNYEYNGRGGLFPLEEPTQDQRDVEIWYQLSAYLLERE